MKPGDLACMLSLVGASALSPTPALANPPAIPEEPPPPSIEPAEVAPPRSMHLRFYLEPDMGGFRQLVLRDDEDLRLPMGIVQPSWACDASEGPHGCMLDWESLEVGCGGGRLTASVVLFPQPQGRDEPPVLRAYSSTGASFDLPVNPQDRVALDGQLVDPAPKCDAAPAGEVVQFTLTDEAVAHHDHYDEARRFRVTSPSFPSLDATVHADAHEECAVRRDRDRTQFTLECRSTEEPYANLLELRVQDGALLWTDVRSEPATGRSTTRGGWKLPCGASVAWPSASVRYEDEDDYVRQAPSEARPLQYRDMLENW